MKKTKVYAYKNCGTCRKALKFLDERCVEYDEVAIRDTPPTVAELRRALAAEGGDLRRLFNNSGGDYKQMNMKDKLPTMGEGEALALLAAHGNLVKRPMVFGGGVTLVGFNEAEWRAAFPPASRKK